MENMIENLKKKRENLQNSLIKVKGVLAMKEDQIEKDRALLSTIEGRITELNETIELMEENGSDKI